MHGPVTVRTEPSKLYMLSLRYFLVVKKIELPVPISVVTILF